MPDGDSAQVRGFSGGGNFQLTKSLLQDRRRLNGLELLAVARHLKETNKFSFFHDFLDDLRSVPPDMFWRAWGSPPAFLWTRLAVQGLRHGWVATDVATELAALSGMPAYIARPYIHIAQRGDRALMAEERYAALQAVARETQASAALARLRALGIRWYVVTDGRGPAWDRQRRLAAFANGKVAVYRTISL